MTSSSATDRGRSAIRMQADIALEQGLGGTFASVAPRPPGLSGKKQAARRI